MLRGLKAQTIIITMIMIMIILMTMIMMMINQIDVYFMVSYSPEFNVMFVFLEVFVPATETRKFPASTAVPVLAVLAWYNGLSCRWHSNQ